VQVLQEQATHRTVVQQHTIGVGHQHLVSPFIQGSVDSSHARQQNNCSSGSSGSSNDSSSLCLTKGQQQQQQQTFAVSPNSADNGASIDAKLVIVTVGSDVPTFSRVAQLFTADAKDAVLKGYSERQLLQRTLPFECTDLPVDLFSAHKFNDRTSSSTTSSSIKLQINQLHFEAIAAARSRASPCIVAQHASESCLPYT
jgi:hypothetical protein